MNRLFRLVASLLFILTSSLLVFGQTSSLSGTVTDPSGAVVAGASVKVSNVATGTEAETTTSSSGTYTVPALGPGLYTVSIEARGFKKVIVNEVKIDAATPATVNATLEVGAQTESVVVQAGAEVLQTQSANVATTITGRQITDLPFTSRDALDLVLNLPGTTTPGRPRTSTINGLPKSAINITIDGINAQDNLLKSTDGFFTYVRPRTDAMEEVTVSTANPGAESAAEGAVQIKFVTKGGTNEYHGGLYEYHRNPVTQANYWFNNRDLRAPAGVNPATFKAPRARNLLNQYGGKLGGPIALPGFGTGGSPIHVFRDRAFFFVNYEEYRLPEQALRQRTILHPRTQQGFFRWVATNASGQKEIREANLLQLAASRNLVSTADPTVAKLLAEIRTTANSVGSVEVINDPNIVANPNVERYSFTNVGGQARFFPTVRLDFNLTSKHRLENIWNYQKFTGKVDFLNSTDPAFPNFPNQGFQGSNRFTNSTALRSTLTSSIVNEARFGLQGGTVLFFPNVNAGQFNNQGGWNLGIGAAGITSATVSTSPSRRNGPVWTFNDTLSWTKGSHTMSLGMAFSRINFWQSADTVARSVTFGIDGTDAAEFMFSNTAFLNASFPGANATDIGRARGIYATLIGSVTALSGFAALSEAGRYSFQGTQVQRARLHEYGYFAADTWRVKQNLTLNYGLRWELQSPLVARNTVYANAPLESLWGVSGAGNLFKPGTLTGKPVTYFRQEIDQQPYNLAKNNFAPSFGFAWTPNFKTGFLSKVFGDGGQSVFRGGYSIAYNRDGIFTIVAPLSGNPGLTIDASRSMGLGNLVGGTLGSLPLLLRETNRLGAPGFSATPDYNNLGSIGNAVRTFDPNLKVPYVQSWSFGWQREINRDTVIEARYVGNRGSRFLTNFDMNEFNIVENGYLAEFKIAQANLIANQAAGRGSTFAYTGAPGTAPLPIHLAYFQGLGGADAANPARYTSTQFSNFANANTLSVNAANPYGLAGVLDGNATFRANAARLGADGKPFFPVNFFRANPDRRGGALFMGNGGRSYYDSLQVELRRRLSKGLLVQGSYTFAKAQELLRVSLRAPLVKSGNGLGITHAFKANWIYELPFGRGKALLGGVNGVVDRFVGGWEFNGVARIQSGAPNAIDGVQLVGTTREQLQKNLQVRFDDAGGIVYYLPQDFITNTIRANNVDITQNTNTTLKGYSTRGAPTGAYFAPANSGGCVQVYSGQCAPPRIILFGPAFTRYDLSIVKRVKITEKVNFELRGEFLNAFNNINFMIGSAANDFTGIGGFGADGFGRITTAYQDLSTTNDPGGRMVQFVARINF
ncbi:MAG TPA: carboxypeptidase-like regulatory domain-containing protein [Blastocatellia bacterium]|nr:carboxypeptidase-like regulatory domain-containing protein [Blastocatellia bacterium]